MVGAATPSHVYPSLPLIRALVQRGSRVTYAVGGQMGDLVAPTGAEVVRLTTVLPVEDAPRSPWPSDPVGVTSLFVDEAIHVLPQLRERFDGDRPDLVLCDTAAIAGDVAASRWGVPAVEVAVSMVAWGGPEGETTRARSREAFEASPGGRECLERRLEWAAREGVGFDLDRIQRGPDDALILIPRMLQPYMETVPASRRFVGPLFDEERLNAGSWEPPVGNERPIVYVSFGTMFNDQVEIFRACVDAFRDGQYHVVMALGRYVDPAVLGPLPEFIEVHRSVSQIAVLKQAAAFVTHGGMGSVVEALWFGVPMVVIPQAGDHFLNAHRVDQIKAGRRLLREHVTAESLARHVDGMVGDGASRARMTELAKEVREGANLARAVDVVERLSTPR